MVVIREPTTFYFDYDLPKDVDQILKDEIKNEIEKLLFKYKHENE